MNCRCIIVIIIIGDIKKKGKKFNQNINRKKNLEHTKKYKKKILYQIILTKCQLLEWIKSKNEIGIRKLED